MILHIVLFRPVASLSTADRKAALDAVAGAVTRCPTVRGCRVGRRVRHGLTGYEEQMREDYTYALMIEFDDMDGLREYLMHPEHERVGGLFTHAAAASLAYDYEMAALPDAARLL